MRVCEYAFIISVMAFISAHASPPGLAPSSNPRLAADFKLQDNQGNTHTLADYQNKVLIVNFWASWCSPCIKEMPSLQRVWEQLDHQAIQVLAINVGENQQTIDNFSKAYPLSFPLLMDSDMATATAWEVKGLPTTYIIDPKGRIAYQVIGDREWDDPVVVQQLRALQHNQKQP